MECSHDMCSWNVLITCAHGVCSWNVLVENARDTYSWTELMASVHEGQKHDTSHTPMGCAHRYAHGISTWHVSTRAIWNYTSPIPSECAHELCSWRALMVCAHRVRSWNCVHGKCSWNVLMNSAHGMCSWNMLLACVREGHGA